MTSGQEILMRYDTAIIGGSYAGLSAGLQLARARRRVLVIDAGLRRNRFAAASHGFLGQDGRAPADIAAHGRRELMAYPTVEWREGEAGSAERTPDGFAIGIGGATVLARRLVLAVGVTDTLPDIPGIAERWGRSVFHCPYCHGYELNEGRIGVIAASPMALHHGLMLPDWGETTLFANGAFSPSAQEAADLARRGTRIELAPIARIAGEAELVLGDGRRETMAGLFTQPFTRLASSLPESLGCEMEDGPTGRYIATDGMKQTSVPGVFACGDAARAAGSVALSVGDGAMAGAATHRSLMFNEA
jgi:thioredoxin reductase